MSIIQKRINSSILILFQNLTADLQTFVNINDLPELLLSVCYNANLLRLTVNVVEGKNFKVSSQATLTILHQMYIIQKLKSNLVRLLITYAYNRKSLSNRKLTISLIRPLSTVSRIIVKVPI